MGSSFGGSLKETAKSLFCQQRNKFLSFFFSNYLSIRFLQMFGLYLSTYLVVVIGLDRWEAISRPLRRTQSGKGRAKIWILTAWILSAVFSVPQVSEWVIHLRVVHWGQPCICLSLSTHLSSFTALHLPRFQRTIHRGVLAVRYLRLLHGQMAGTALLHSQPLTHVRHSFGHPHRDIFVGHFETAT